MTYDKIKKSRPFARPAVGMASRVDQSRTIPILAQKTKKRKVELLDEVRVQALWLARTHVNPDVRHKHWAIYATCMKRIAEICNEWERAA